jgi:hypothetical protein
MAVDKYSGTCREDTYNHGFSNNMLNIGKPARADNGNEHMKWDIETTPRADKSAPTSCQLI